MHRAGGDENETRNARVKCGLEKPKGTHEIRFEEGFQIVFPGSLKRTLLLPLQRRVNDAIYAPYERVHGLTITKIARHPFDFVFQVLKAAAVTVRPIPAAYLMAGLDRLLADCTF